MVTQAYSHVKEKTILHPITYVSGLFRVTWTGLSLSKETYAIYKSPKKLSFYLDDIDITLRSEHLPLQRFLENKTLNSKVNN